MYWVLNLGVLNAYWCWNYFFKWILKALFFCCFPWLSLSAAFSWWPQVASWLLILRQESLSHPCHLRPRGCSIEVLITDEGGKQWPLRKEWHPSRGALAPQTVPLRSPPFWSCFPTAPTPQRGLPGLPDAGLFLGSAHRCGAQASRCCLPQPRSRSGRRSFREAAGLVLSSPG